jgi:hypothetical protein
MENSFRDIQLVKLTERAKELKCIYSIIEILKDEEAAVPVIIRRIIEAIPPGWQHPTVCEVKVVLDNQAFASPDFQVTPWMQQADIIIDNHVSGQILVCYTQNVLEKPNPFFPEEHKLLNTIAERLSESIFYRRLKKSLDFIQSPEMHKNGSEIQLLSLESDEHWRWRHRLAELIANKMNMDRFGVAGIYLIGSTKNANAGPDSDVDLLVHFRGDERQLCQLQSWTEGWGHALAEINYMKTGHQTDHSLIDLHIITDEDIANRTSYAVMIGSTENSAKPLRIKSS